MEFNILEVMASFRDRRVICRLVCVSRIFYRSSCKNVPMRQIVVDRFYPDGTIKGQIEIFLEGYLATNATLRLGHVMKVEYSFSPMTGRVAKNITYMGSHAAFFGRSVNR